MCIVAMNRDGSSTEKVVIYFKCDKITGDEFGIFDEQKRPSKRLLRFRKNQQLKTEMFLLHKMRASFVQKGNVNRKQTKFEEFNIFI